MWMYFNRMMIVLVILLLVISIGLGVAYSMGLLTPKKEEEVIEVVAPIEVVQEVSAPVEVVQPIETAPPPEPQEGVFPDDIPGLSGKYTFESFDNTQGVWLDESGQGHHIISRAGEVKKAGDYIFGGINDGMKIPLEVLGPNDVYTMFWVARYNGTNKGRIFDGMDNNWLSGFHEGDTGVAHHGKWITSGSVHGPHAWIQGSDSPNMFRTFGKNRMTDGSVYGTTPQITINLGATAGQKSDWAIKEMIFYNRLLRVEEVEKVEAYLLKKHFPELPENISTAKGYIDGYVDDPRGAPHGYGTAEFCRKQAKELGYPIWGHRAEDQETHSARNKCFYYKAGVFDTFTENTSDDSHVIGCVDEEVSVLEGCRDEI
jgi:hypothetical protein